jgi:hypothetical protein
MTGPARSQAVLRALVLLGPVLAVLATGPAGRWPVWWVLLPVVALAGVAAWFPDSPFLAAVDLAVLAWWAVALGGGVPAWAVAAAVALVVGHVAALLTSYGPVEMPLDPATARLWTRRAALVLLTVPVAWVAGRVLEGQPEQPGVWVAGTGLACVVIVAATALLPARRSAQDA